MRVAVDRRTGRAMVPATTAITAALALVALAVESILHYEPSWGRVALIVAFFVSAAHNVALWAASQAVAQQERNDQV